MIKYSDVTTNPELQEAATAYEQAFGGRFVGDEPGPGLVYLDANGTAYGPPDGYTKEDLLTALEGGKDTLPSIWTNLDELDIDPDILYLPDDESIVLKSTVLFSYPNTAEPRRKPTGALPYRDWPDTRKADNRR